MKKNYKRLLSEDGFGAQYQAIMSGIVFCKFNNYNYIHTPFKKVGHNQNSKLLNNFIGIPILLNKNNIKIDIKEKYSRKVHRCIKPSRYYTKEAIDIIKKYYYSTPKPVIDDIDIAIHIRRGDVRKGTRFTPNSYYNKIIKFLNSKYPNYNIKIFSQGKLKNFSDIIGNNISFELNTDIQRTFHSLVSAKILVTAKSSFSYSAAILNSNEIFYINFWHQPLNHWKRVSKFILN